MIAASASKRTCGAGDAAIAEWSDNAASLDKERQAF